MGNSIFEEDCFFTVRNPSGYTNQPCLYEPELVNVRVWLQSDGRGWIEDGVSEYHEGEGEYLLSAASSSLTSPGRWRTLSETRWPLSCWWCALRIYEDFVHPVDDGRTIAHALQIFLERDQNILNRVGGSWTNQYCVSLCPFAPQSIAA